MTMPEHSNSMCGLTYAWSLVCCSRRQSNRTDGLARHVRAISIKTRCYRACSRAPTDMHVKLVPRAKVNYVGGRYVFNSFICLSVCRINIKNRGRIFMIFLTGVTSNSRLDFGSDPETLEDTETYYSVLALYSWGFCPPGPDLGMCIVPGAAVTKSPPPVIFCQVGVSHIYVTESQPPVIFMPT